MHVLLARLTLERFEAYRKFPPCCFFCCFLVLSPLLVSCLMLRLMPPPRYFLLPYPPDACRTVSITPQIRICSVFPHTEDFVFSDELISSAYTGDGLLLPFPPGSRNTTKCWS